MKKYINRDLYTLVVGNQHDNGITGGVRLRSNRTTSTVRWAGADKKYFGDMLFVHGYEYSASVEKNKYLRGQEGRLTFDAKIVGNWVRDKNKAILKIARERANGYIDWDKEYGN